MGLMGLGLMGLGLVGFGLGVGGCGVAPDRMDEPVERLTGEWVDPGPFEATRMRIYPLTRVDATSGGDPVIVLSLEMMDRWGDTVKAVGDLTVRVWPSRSVGGGSDAETWEVSLWDPEANAGYFDPASRTYRIPLTDPPGWITSGEGPSRDARVQIEAVLRTPAVGGEQRSLRDTFTVDKPE